MRDAKMSVKTANCHAALHTSAVYGGNVPSWMIRVVLPEILVIISPLVFRTSSMTFSSLLREDMAPYPFAPFFADLTSAIASFLSWMSFLMAATWLGRSTSQSKYLQWHERISLRHRFRVKERAQLVSIIYADVGSPGDEHARKNRCPVEGPEHGWLY